MAFSDDERFEMDPKLKEEPVKNSALVFWSSTLITVLFLTSMNVTDVMTVVVAELTWR